MSNEKVIDAKEMSSDAPTLHLSGKNIAQTSFILVIILFFALIGLYWYFTYELSQLGNTDDKMQTQFRQNQQTVEGSLNQLQQQAAAQQKILIEIQDLKNGSTPAWRLTEAKYLAQLANYQIVFARDTQAALSLLQIVGQRLASIDDPGLIGIRQQVANTIASLQAVPKVDLAELLTRITALQTQASQLPAIGLPPARLMQEEFQEPAISGSPVKKAIKDSWTTLQKIVIIRKHDQPIEPLLSPEQQAYLQQNLQLILQQAQWAALRGKQDVYQASLKQAQNWIQHYFARNMPATQAFIQAVGELQKINVEPVLPNLTPLVQAIKQINLTTPAARPSAHSKPSKQEA